MAQSVQVALESQSIRAPRKLDSLTGLRFFAALMVFFFHTGTSLNPIQLAQPVNPFANNEIAHWYELIFSTGGFVGVSFFFVLSGFVLSWSARPGYQARAFIRRRLVKIFPNHLVMWAIAMLLFAGAVTSWKGWLPNLFLVHPWSPNFGTSLSVNTPSWSLGSELLFYLSFPLLIRPISRMTVRRLWFWAAATVVGLFIYQLTVIAVIPDDRIGVAGVPNLQFWLGYLFPGGRMFEFVLGAILARIVLAGKWIRIDPLLSVGLFVFGYVASMFVPRQFTFNLVTLVPIAVMIAAFADADMRGAPTGLRSRLTVWLGNVSFGFYMCQGVTIFYPRSVMGGAQYNTLIAFLVLLGLFAATLFGGWCLYRFVEMPMMRRWSRARTAPSSQISGSG